MPRTALGRPRRERRARGRERARHRQASASVGRQKIHDHITPPCTTSGGPTWPRSTPRHHTGRSRADLAADLASISRVRLLNSLCRASLPVGSPLGPRWVPGGITQRGPNCCMLRVGGVLTRHVPPPTVPRPAPPSNSHVYATRPRGVAALLLLGSDDLPLPPSQPAALWLQIPYCPPDQIPPGNPDPRACVPNPHVGA